MSTLLVSTPHPNVPSFAELLARAVSEPGQIHTAYTAFHGYSVGNQLLALFACAARGIQPGPLATFPGWKARGRYVRKGEKAITLCMPITVKRRDTDAAETEDASTFTRFIYRPRWFVLAQTDGADYAAPDLPDWQKARALETLDITEIPFDLTDGNVQGYARGRSIAVSPVAGEPYKTLFHELAHVALGHTAEADHADDDRTPRSLREVEAESVALLCCAALQLPGEAYARGYIQHWNRDGQPIPERSAARIFKTADAILRAGRPADVATLDGE
jgi:antirestriction protein ArdC